MSTTSLGTSNMRGSSKKTRVNPARTSKTVRSNLRQNSLVSNPPASDHDAPEIPLNIYPGISHFTDAITGLPRNYRRHSSLLKEVDAKAWLFEENLQNLLQQCLIERQARPTVSTANTVANSIHIVADDATTFSATNSVSGTVLDNASQYSSQSVDPVVHQRRQLYGAVRQNVVQMLILMDEKNHVINNANEDLSKDIRRLNQVFNGLQDEFSETTRLGSLKHWAYTDLNPPVKKITAAMTRREAAANLANLADNDIAHRSESRREAMLAKKQKTAQPVDSDFDERVGGRKMVTAKGRKPAEPSVEPVAAIVTTKRKKPEKSMGGVAMERSLSSAMGGRAMSREPSQQDNNSKKRKASAAPTTVARKRINAATVESPKLISSPLANGKDAVKRSPALSTVRPVPRGRQNSAQTTDSSKNRALSSISYRNGNGLNISTPALGNVAAATGKSTTEVKNTMKETTNSRGDKLVEENSAAGGEHSMRGGLLLGKPNNKSGNRKKEVEETSHKTISSPRLQSALSVSETKSARARASKTSTPMVSTFAEADVDESGANGAEHNSNPNSATTNNSSSYGSQVTKPKRPARPRMKDHHGLHDSLSPKGLPMKRTHTKNASFSSLYGVSSQQTPNATNSTTAKATSSSRVRGRDKDKEKEKDKDGNREHEIGHANEVQNSRHQDNNNTTTVKTEPSTNAPASAHTGSRVENSNTTNSSETTVTRSSSTSLANKRRSPTISEDGSKTKDNASTNNNVRDTKPNTTITTTTSNDTIKSDISSASISPISDDEEEEEEEIEPAKPGTTITSTTTNNQPNAEDADEEELDEEEEEEEDPADDEEEDDEEEEDEAADEDELRYCYCNNVSYGEMVACDNKHCPREWFHLDCIGLKALPKSAKWFCDECKDGIAKRGRFAGPNSGHAVVEGVK